MSRLSLSLQIGKFENSARHRSELARHRVLRCLRHALDREVQSAEFTVRVVGEAEGRQLNETYRGKQGATDVLTFDYAPAPALMADLVLCGPVLERQALQLGLPLFEHYAHLIVHGALHAQGWDHESSDADAQAMEAREIAILAGLGFGNPYAV